MLISSSFGQLLLGLFACPKLGMAAISAYEMFQAAKVSTCIQEGVGEEVSEVDPIQQELEAMQAFFMSLKRDHIRHFLMALGVTTTVKKTDLSQLGVSGTSILRSRLMREISQNAVFDESIRRFVCDRFHSEFDIPSPEELLADVAQRMDPRSEESEMDELGDAMGWTAPMEQEEHIEGLEELSELMGWI